MQGALLTVVVLTCGLSAVAAKASQYLSVVSVFGRIAEHKALGYTSSYSVSWQPHPPLCLTLAATDLRAHSSCAVDSK